MEWPTLPQLVNAQSRSPEALSDSPIDAELDMGLLALEESNPSDS